MRSGRSWRAARRHTRRGYTYLLLLFMLALSGAAMATLGERWTSSAQRERETELLFIGAQFSQALADYREATPPGQPAAPETLHELLVDARSSPPGHPLRKLYTDPWTRQADWVLKRDAEGRIEGLSSRSRQPALRRVTLPLQPDADPRSPRVGDWLFLAGPPPPPKPMRETP
jgi:type II secretory pathway pseudopilin PulG